MKPIVIFYCLLFLLIVGSGVGTYIKSHAYSEQIQGHGDVLKKVFVEEGVSPLASQQLRSMVVTSSLELREHIDSTLYLQLTLNMNILVFIMLCLYYSNKKSNHSAEKN